MAYMLDLADGVLIVDDAKSVRSALRDFLERVASINVCGEAAGGTEAIEKAKRLHPGLIVMDVVMPDMNGIEAASVIRQNGSQAHIIVFTLYADMVGPTIAKAAGIDEVVSKAEGAAALMDAIVRIVTEGRGHLN